MNRAFQNNNGSKVRTWTFAAGGTLLLAVLTVILCLLGGVFNFQSPEGREPTPVPVPSQSYAPPAQSETPGETERFSISAVASEGGEISPSGLVEVEKGGSVSLSIIPHEGYELKELKVDGKSVEPAGTYTFSDVRENHSLYAVFEKEPEETESPSPSPSPSARPSQTPIPTSPVGSPTDIG